MIDAIYPFNQYVTLAAGGTSPSVGIIADNINTFKALLAMSPVTSSSTPPQFIRLKMGLFNITMNQNGTAVDYHKTNTSITYAMLKVSHMDIYLIGQSYFPDEYLFGYIIHQFFQFGVKTYHII